MGKGRIPKDLLYGEFEKGCPLVCFKDVCKRDMKSATIDIERWELMVKDHFTRQHFIKEGIQHAERQRIHETCDKWRREISEKPWVQWYYLIQFSNVKDVIKTVIQKSVFLVTKDVV